MDIKFFYVNENFQDPGEHHEGIQFHFKGWNGKEGRGRSRLRGRMKQLRSRRKMRADSEPGEAEEENVSEKSKEAVTLKEEQESKEL